VRVTRAVRPAAGDHPRERPPHATSRAPARDVHALQRRATHRAVAAVLARQKTVNVELRTPPPLPKPPPASDIATPDSRGLAAEIDTLDKLGDAELIKLRTDVSLKLPSRGVTLSEQEEHDRLLKQLHAIEFLAARRRREARHYGQSARERDLGPIQPDWNQWAYVRRDHGKRRAWVRWLVEQRVRETGSFKRALEVLRSGQAGEIADELAAIEAEGERFGKEFTRQATRNAERVLDGSQIVIEELLRGYGLHISARSLATDWLKTQDRVPGIHVTAESAANVLIARSRGEDATAFGRGQRKRESLGGEVQHLKGLQAKVAAAQKAMWDRAQTTRGEAAKEKAAFIEAKRELTAEWFRAERLHPVLAHYRRGAKREKSPIDDSALGKIDLGKLDADSVDEQLKTVIVRVIPTLAHIFRARGLLNNGMTALKMPAVVALTQTTMFIPDGSLRDGIVNDLVAAQKRENWLITAAALALSLVTLLPTGGASLAMVNVAAGGLAALSALGEWDRKELQEVLTDTDLDKARSLSQEEPSLAGFAWALVGLGLEPLIAMHAFRKARELRTAMRRGDSTDPLVRELDELGERHGARGLGRRALSEAEAAERARMPKRSLTPPRDPRTNRGVNYPEEPAVYGTVGEFRTGARAALQAAGAKPADETVMAALRALIKSGKLKGNRELLDMIEEVWRIRRNPKHIEDAMAAVWAEASRTQKSTAEALESLLGGHLTEVRGELTRKHLQADSPFLDLAFAADFHGAYIHAFEEFMLNRVKPGLGTRYRKAVGNAHGPAVPLPDGRSKEFWRAAWDAVVDVDVGENFNRAEVLGRILQKHLGLPRWVP
jgi:hypothetical protein